MEKKALIYKIYSTDKEETSIYYNGTYKKYMTSELKRYYRAYKNYVDKRNIKLWSPVFYFFSNYKLEQLVIEFVEECVVDKNELKNRLNYYINQLPEPDQLNRTFSKQVMVDYVLKK
jgi:hypothetical protein